MNDVKQMANMDIKAQCRVKSPDEIGFLATNINALYQSLLTTIHNLEQEKEKVSLAEREKLNFLRAASHELKTPVTELNATLENMILCIGDYSDYETYLPKCKEVTEQLGIMIKDILNTSRLQMEASNEKSEEFVLQELLLEICEPYKLIAQIRGIRFHTIISGKTVMFAPVQLLKKAISNILSNAVNYTSVGKNIFVTIHSDFLTVNNECTPLSDEQLQNIFEPFYRLDYSKNQNTVGNGFGLYIVETIFKKLKLDYKFIPLENNDGMSFTVQF
ncbi:sensor histidine kinase [Vallitalea maricola]|uniref:sensor histidine kinase n=1 Tax=Vallitalea maricola TaxID=3074433 RepID=UPI0030DC822E